MSTTIRDPAALLETIQQSNRFVIQQVFKPIANEYRISAPPAGSEEGEPLLFVKQKKLKIKEDIRFRLSPDDEAHLFMIKSKTVFEFRGRHEVLDANGAAVGLLEKVFGASLLRSHRSGRTGACSGSSATGTCSSSAKDCKMPIGGSSSRSPLLSTRCKTASRSSLASLRSRSGRAFGARLVGVRNELVACRALRAARLSPRRR